MSMRLLIRRMWHILNILKVYDISVDAKSYTDVMLETPYSMPTSEEVIHEITLSSDDFPSVYVNNQKLSTDRVKYGLAVVFSGKNTDTASSHSISMRCEKVSGSTTTSGGDVSKSIGSNNYYAVNIFVPDVKPGDKIRLLGSADSNSVNYDQISYLVYPAQIDHPEISGKFCIYAMGLFRNISPGGTNPYGSPAWYPYLKTLSNTYLRGWPMSGITKGEILVVWVPPVWLDSPFFVSEAGSTEPDMGWFSVVNASTTYSPYYAQVWYPSRIKLITVPF